jgi:uncharacterized protein (TIGR02453 family)
MKENTIGSFEGFSKDTIEFLISLKYNNNKSWFEEHRQDYMSYVLDPFKNLVSELASFMLQLDPQLGVTPAVDKTISRIYKDARFSKDKSRYRSNVWITFKRPSQDWKECPSFYFEITPDFYRYGMGFYVASKETMLRFRQKLDERPEEFLQAVAFYNSGKFSLEGDSYKRLLDGEKSKDIIDWYQKKTFYLACNRRLDKTLFGRSILEEIKTGFTELAPLYHYLWDIKLEENRT